MDLSKFTIEEWATLVGGIGFVILYAIFELLTYLSKRRLERETKETLDAQEELAKKQKEKLDEKR